MSNQAFAYIGEAKTAQEFIAYVKGYNFGSVPPEFIVIHNTAIPDASWAPLNGNPTSKWNRNEDGLSSEEIKAKRKPQLDGIRDFYRDVRHWTSGPHLFIDERWIWLFTPMHDVGTHATTGNSYRDSAGQLHYSIGVETVGWFDDRGWPQSMQKLLQVAIQTLRDHLGTFEIKYTPAPTNRPDLHNHEISFHRDYNKPSCPGAVITPEYAIPILQKPYGTVYQQWRMIAPCSVFQSPDPDGELASGPDSGQTRLEPNEVISVGDVKNGWLWISTGIGFIPSGYARLIP